MSADRVAGILHTRGMLARLMGVRRTGIVVTFEQAARALRLLRGNAHPHAVLARETIADVVLGER